MGGRGDESTLRKENLQVPESGDDDACEEHGELACNVPVETLLVSERGGEGRGESLLAGLEALLVSERGGEA